MHNSKFYDNIYLNKIYFVENIAIKSFLDFDNLRSSFCVQLYYVIVKERDVNYNMEIIKNYLTNNDCYRIGTITPKIGIQIHTIGTGQGTAQSVANYWNQPGIEACVHYVVDADTPGKVLQLLPEERRAWADAGYGNNNLITIEICESDYIKYTNGANYEILDNNIFKSDILRGYNTAVELCAKICNEKGWNPMAKLSSGLYLISSHDEGRRAGLSSDHVDPTHIWNRFGLTMDDFRKDVTEKMKNQISNSDGTKIEGKPDNLLKQMIEYLSKANPDIPSSILNILHYYISEGESENIRGDIAFCQSCLETGNFTFENSAVTLDQNNFCGLGVTQNGMKGHSFETPQLGIRAQIQHLKAYANKDPLNLEKVDPRFDYVTRGVSPYWEWLGIKENPYGKGWASGEGYGKKILKIYDEMKNMKGTNVADPIATSIYRVRKTWENARSQIGAFENLDNAKRCADENRGYYVYDSNGFVVYPQTFQVKVTIDDLRIRTGAGLSYTSTGFCPKGVYTIINTKNIDGYTWGELKSGIGWIALEYTARI